jgi:signal transduction histidine kinase
VPTAEDRHAAERARRPVQVALAVLLCIVVGLVAAGAFAGYRIYSLGNQRFVDQAGPFFAVTEDLAVEMLNQETAVRGYVITGDPSTLAPYRQGKKYSAIELALIAKDASFDPAIPGHLAAMRREVTALEAYFGREIALVRSGPAGQRRAQAQIAAGKAHFDHLRGASRALINDAGNVIKRSHREQRRTLLTWWLVLGLAGSGAVAIAVVLLLRVPRRLYQLFREERFARREAEQSADASRALDHVREAVVLLDDAGTVRYGNPTAEKLFGLHLPSDSQVLLGALDHFLGAGANAGARPLVLGGQVRWLTCVESKFDGGRVVVFRDVSDDHRLEQLRSDFVATAAHELRTPLAAIYGAVRTLRQETYELPPALGEQFLAMIERESDRLKLVTDQLVVSAQLDAADLHLQPQPVDAMALCEEVLDAAQLRKPNEIEFKVDKSESPVSLAADPDRLRQVIGNLIDNAIKYSPDGGGIELRVFANGSSGVIEVADQGLGIPADEQQRIFDKFYRLDPDMTGGVGGSGLGLYISRELVRQMGGQLSVSSELRSGSIFRVTLPLASPVEEAQPLRQDSSLARPV